MRWQQIVGWQLLVFGSLWMIAVYGWGDSSWQALAAVPSVAETVVSAPDLARMGRAAAYGPGLVAVALGVAALWDARRRRRTWAEQLADEHRNGRGDW